MTALPSTPTSTLMLETQRLPIRTYGEPRYGTPRYGDRPGGKAR